MSIRNYKDTQIIVYFAGAVTSYYQIKQWQPVFEQLNQTHRLMYLIQNYECYRHFIKQKNPLNAVYVESFSDLIEFYQDNEFPIVLYINNSLPNFQSVRYSRGYHIHLNHGESEKESMRSNQAQAYDYVFTVGQRGIERYQEYLLSFNPKKFRIVGRPQLDFIEPISLNNAPNQQVILYAPTWEATHPSMNYTSVSHMGVDLVKALLAHPNYYVIYKPHSALGSRDESLARINQQLIQMVEQADNGCFLGEEEINNIFPVVDFAIMDNSSVMIDYLSTLKPAAYIEVLEDQSINRLTEVFEAFKPNQLTGLLGYIDKQLNRPPTSQMREVKMYYLGDYQQGESTQAFIQALGELIQQRNQRIHTLKKTGQNDGKTKLHFSEGNYWEEHNTTSTRAPRRYGTR